MARIHRRTYKKDLHDPDDHDGVITYLESDILECEVKWALGSITTNKASGRDGIPAKPFQIPKDDAVHTQLPPRTWTLSRDGFTRNPVKLRLQPLTCINRLQGPELNLAFVTCDSFS